MMQLMLFFHIVGVVMFLGAGLSALVVNRLALAAADPRALDGANGRLARIAGMGAGLVFLSGIGAIHAAAISVGALLAQPWLGTMILLGIIAAGLIGIAGARARRLAAAPLDPTSGHAARQVQAKLHLVFVLAGMGAIVCGIWRF